MAEMLTALRTVQNKENQKPEPLLTPVSTQESQVHSQKSHNSQPQSDSKVARSTSPVKTWNSPTELPQLLRSQPNLHTVINALHKLSHAHDFNLDAPGPLQAQIIHATVTIVVPTFFDTFDQKSRRNLGICLRNVAGINALLARMRVLSDQLSASKSTLSNPEELHALLEVTKMVLPIDLDFGIIWKCLHEASTDSVKRQFAWKEFVNLMGSGKVISIIARAEDVLQEHSRKGNASWLSKGSDYAAWLGRGIVSLLQAAYSESPAAQLLAKAFSLGYSQSLAKHLVIESQPKGFSSLVAQLPTHAARQLLEATLQCLSAMSGSESDMVGDGKEMVSELAALIVWLIESGEVVRGLLVSRLSDPALNSTVSFRVRAASITAIAKIAPDELDGILEISLTTFSNQLFINHGSIIQQESMAQTILLTAGALHRKTPMAVLMISRSSGHMQGVSNRLHSSNLRARWLGMIVGTAVSSLVDKDGSKMEFGTDDMETEEAGWYVSLVKTQYVAGDINAFEHFRDAQNVLPRGPKRKSTQAGSERLPIINGKQTFGPVRPPIQTEVIGDRVTELSDEDDDEDDDLKPYAKPDDDPEDSDEDATLVNRDKPRPPVYIRDLMRMLRDTEKPDRFQMGIRHAASLIRRKLNFGGEVSDHAEELGLMLCDLQDPFDTDEFDELKLQALIAVLMSDVSKMAPWLSRQAFSGDYSLSQRCIMLSALGLGGREIAGLTDADSELNPALPLSNSFPSKQLTGRLRNLYDPGSSSVKRLEAASNSIEHQLIKPLALDAADKATSELNAVKVRTFSSRLTTANRTKRKPAPNRLAKIFSSAFFFPMVSRYQQELMAYGQSSVYASAPFVQVTFIKTLALLLHASGPATLQLLEVTTAFWDLLLSLRVQAASDISILEAVLFSLLTLLEVNTEHSGVQRLALDCPKQLMETQHWVELVFERIGGGNLVLEGSDEETRNRTLAAGVLVKCREIIEAYQGQVTGLR